MTNQCPRCASPRSGDDRFCYMCGLDLRTSTESPVPQPQLPPQQAPIPPQPQVYQQPDPLAAPQQFAPQPQGYQQPTSQPQPAAGLCPRCGAPLYPGYSQCANCGFNSAAPWGATPPAAARRGRILPIALAIGVVVVLVAAGAIVLVVSNSRSGAAGPKQVTITLPAAGLTMLNMAPVDTFAFHVSESSVPASASDLAQYVLATCTGYMDGATYAEIASGLGSSQTRSGSSGDDSTGCIEDALKADKTILVTPRGTALPVDAAVVELIFK
jgi:hypothetical protein